MKQGDQYKLYVQEYDEHTGDWGYFNGVSVYDNLNEIKKTLFYEYDFYCEENAELDKHGDEVFVEEIEIPISSIQGVSREEISLFITSNNNKATPTKKHHFTHMPTITRIMLGKNKKKFFVRFIKTPITNRLTGYLLS